MFGLRAFDELTRLPFISSNSPLLLSQLFTSILRPSYYTVVMSDLRLVVHPSGYTSLTGTAFFTSLLSTLKVSAPSPAVNARHSLHVTLLTKHEASSLRERGVANPSEGAVFRRGDNVPVGLGGDERRGVSFAVVLVNRANVLRRRAGLPLKNFHLTLSTPPFSSPEDFPHDLSTLREPVHIPSLTSLPFLDALSHHFFLSANFSSSFTAATRLYTLSLPSPSSPLPFVRLADAAYRHSNGKTAMLAYGRAFELATSVGTREYALKQLWKCSDRTEWGTGWYEREEGELEELGRDVRGELLRPWGEELREAVCTRAEKMEPPTLMVEAEERLVVEVQGEDVRLMRNFVRRLFSSPPFIR